MSRLSKNIIYNLMGQGLLLILGFVAVKYVFKQLGEDALGLIYFTLMMNTVLCSVLEMGVCSTTTREVAAHFRDDPDYVRDLIRTGSLFYWGSYFLLAVMIYFGAPLIVDYWINLATMEKTTATRALQILGVAALVALPRSLYGSLLRGLQYMEFNNLIDVVTMGLQQFGIIVILSLGGGVLHIIYWVALCFGLGVLVYFFACIYFFSWRAMIPGYSSGVFRRNIGYLCNMMFISILAMIHTQADKWILSKLVPLGTFGYYSFVYGVAARASILTGAIYVAILPSFSELASAGDWRTLRSQYWKFQDLVCFSTVPLFAAVPFAAIPLFTFMFNAEIAKMLILPVTFLAIGFYMNGTMTVPYAFSLAVGKPEIAARLNFFALFVVLPVTGVLIYFFGLTGAGFSWVFYHLFGYLYGVPRICAECLGIPTAKWYSHVVRIAGLVGGTYGAAWIILQALGAHSIIFLILAYVAASIIFLIGAYWMVGDGIRESIFRILAAAASKMCHTSLVCHW